MHVMIMTRGKSRRDGYSYFPPGTADSWWRKYRDETSFEHPTLLLEARPGGWRLYVGGIPSDRRDSTGTRIQYSCMLAGESADGAAVGTARSLVRIWSSLAGRAALGCALDRWATEDVVLAWYQSGGVLPSADDVERNVADAIRQASSGPGQPRPVAARDHLATGPQYPGDGAETQGTPLTRAGGLSAPDGPDALFSATAVLLRNQVAGCVLVLNLVNFGSQQPSEELRELLAPLGSYFLLLDTTSSAPVRVIPDWPVREVVPPKEISLAGSPPKRIWLRQMIRKTAAGIRSAPAVSYRAFRMFFSKKSSGDSKNNRRVRKPR